MKQLLETSLKPLETLAAESATYMFQESFKNERYKYLFLMISFKSKNSLKQQCFPKCFKKSGQYISVGSDLEFLKQISPTIP
jgi:hypothetical protein